MPKPRYEWLLFGVGGEYLGTAYSQAEATAHRTKVPGVYFYRRQERHTMTELQAQQTARKNAQRTCAIWVVVRAEEYVEGDNEAFDVMRHSTWLHSDLGDYLYAYNSEGSEVTYEI